MSHSINQKEVYHEKKIKPSILKATLLCILFLALTSVVYAEETQTDAQAGGIAFSTILLTIAIILGIVCALFTLYQVKRLEGGKVSNALLMYGLGMIAVVISLLSVTWFKELLGDAAGTMHDLFFIIGFLVMSYGTKKIVDMMQSLK